MECLIQDHPKIKLTDCRLNVHRDYIGSIRDGGKTGISSSSQVLLHAKTKETVSHHWNNRH